MVAKEEEGINNKDIEEGEHEDLYSEPDIDVEKHQCQSDSEKYLSTPLNNSHCMRV